MLQALGVHRVSMIDKVARFPYINGFYTAVRPFCCTIGVAHHVSHPRSASLTTGW